MEDKLLLRKRAIVETIIDQLKNISQIDQQAAVATFHILELEDARAADQWADDLEVGILRRRADQDDRAILDVWQQCVLNPSKATMNWALHVTWVIL